MWRWLTVILLAFMGLHLYTQILTAQEDETGCEWESIIARLADASEELDTLEGEDALGVLVDLARDMQWFNAACHGLVFTSREYGREPAIGPVRIPAGTWRGTMETEGYAIIHLIVLEGDCEVPRTSFLSFSRGTGRAQRVFSAESECDLIIEITNITDDWEFRFDKLR